MTQSKSMDEAVRVKIYDLLGKALQAVKVGDNAGGERLCDEAWTQMPEPKFGWDVTYMCLSGTVDCLRAAGSYDKAINLINDYLGSGYYLDYQYGPDFWLGTLYYEKGELGKAYSHIESADKLSRGRCFVEEDRRYKDFFKTYKTSKQIPS